MYVGDKINSLQIYLFTNNLQAINFQMFLIFINKIIQIYNHQTTVHNFHSVHINDYTIAQT